MNTETETEPSTNEPSTNEPSANDGKPGTQILSVRLPSVELRQRLNDKCREDDLAVSAFITMAVEAYLEGRLKIRDRPPQPPPKRPPFLIPHDSDFDGDFDSD